MGWQPDDVAGTRLGSYELVSRLAVGGSAEIFLGVPQRGQRRLVVLKRLLAERNDAERLLAEAKVMASLRHKNIVAVENLELAGEDIVLACECVTGVTLDELLGASTVAGERLPLPLVVGLIDDIAGALGHMHTLPRPIVHRDLTPKNVMLRFDGRTKLLDFGIARFLGSRRSTKVGVVLGTSAYMSPEQATGEEVDTQSDLFSLGIVFHELVTGRRLFRRATALDEMAAVYQAPIPSLRTLRPEVPRALDELVLRLLKRGRAQRFASAAELRAALAQCGVKPWTFTQRAAYLARHFHHRLGELDRLKAHAAAIEESTDVGAEAHEAGTELVAWSAGPKRRLEGWWAVALVAGGALAGLCWALLAF